MLPTTARLRALKRHGVSSCIVAYTTAAGRLASTLFCTFCNSLRLSEWRHVYVALCRLRGSCDVPEPREGQIETRLTVGESPDHAGSPTDLLHDPLVRIGDADSSAGECPEDQIGRRPMHLRSIMRVALNPRVFAIRFTAYPPAPAIATAKSGFLPV